MPLLKIHSCSQKILEWKRSRADLQEADACIVWCVMSRNTLVTSDKLPASSSHTVTSLHILRFPELRFHAQLGCKAPTLLALTSSSHQAISGSSDHGRLLPRPYLSFMSKSASCTCPTLLSCVLYSCKSHSCVSAHTSDTRLNALLSILVYKTLAYVCIRHV